MTTRSGRERALRKATAKPLVDAKAISVHSQQLTRLVREGALERVARGTYRIVDRPMSEHQSFAIVSTIAPRSVICLLSALAFHEVGTQLPFEVWVAIERGTRPPRLQNPPVRVMRFSGDAFRSGIETHTIDGTRVRLYGIAKTIADLFKFRNRIGVDIAIEALRDAWQRRLVTIEEIDRYARVCRVQRVMQPYVEALVA
ncbi:MAG: type IV toxin-antitoxin system AbiEi family antitoxin domain-containing protein [Acidobacteria bacterium]|nr:type IV toxin-antitoxin system AbiEi family antitoxin domain-containing protein [Acidobacteriota bacterium]